MRVGGGGGGNGTPQSPGSLVSFSFCGFEAPLRGLRRRGREERTTNTRGRTTALSHTHGGQAERKRAPTAHGPCREGGRAGSRGPTPCTPGQEPDWTPTPQDPQEQPRTRAALRAQTGKKNYLGDQLAAPTGGRLRRGPLTAVAAKLSPASGAAAGSGPSLVPVLVRLLVLILVWSLAAAAAGPRSPSSGAAAACCSAQPGPIWL